MILEEPIEYYRQLPHFQHIGASFFVTFRLFDSLPQEVIFRLKSEKMEAMQKIAEKKLSQEDNNNAIAFASKQYLYQFNEALDTTKTGSNCLNIPELAQIVINKLKEYEGKYYYLDAYCIMSNHVHILIDFSAQIPANPSEFVEDNYVQLSKVMQLIKGGSSRQINEKLGKKGTIWQEENFDTYIRNDKHREMVIKYILNNPIKIGLVSHWQDFSFAGLGDRFKADKRFF